MEEIVPIFAIVFSMSIPILAIIGGIYHQVNKIKADRDIRQLIIEHQTDAETAKLLMANVEKPKSNGFATLRGGCLLVGGGIAALLANAAGLFNTNILVFWVATAFGVGVGLLVAFAIEWKLTKKAKEGEEEQPLENSKE